LLGSGSLMTDEPITDDKTNQAIVEGATNSVEGDGEAFHGNCLLGFDSSQQFEAVMGQSIKDVFQLGSQGALQSPKMSNALDSQSPIVSDSDYPELVWAGCQP
jgi:hypothetical protein